MSAASRWVAGVLLIAYPTVVVGGVSLVSLLVYDGDYADNALRQDLWRAGHAHGGVLLLLSLVALRYVDETALTERVRWFVRLAFPSAAVLLATAFFLSMLSPDATQPSPLINLAYLVALLLVAAMLTLGFGLVRANASARAQKVEKVRRR